MPKFIYIALVASLISTLRLHAQQNPSFQVYRTWHTAIELLEKGKYVAAAEQFRLVEDNAVNTRKQAPLESELSLLKENAQYYEPLCALELGNDDAQSMFLKFINDHP